MRSVVAIGESLAIGQPRAAGAVWRSRRPQPREAATAGKPVARVWLTGLWITLILTVGQGVLCFYGMWDGDWFVRSHRSRDWTWQTMPAKIRLPLRYIEGRGWLAVSFVGTAFGLAAFSARASAQKTRPVCVGVFTAVTLANIAAVAASSIWLYASSPIVVAAAGFSRRLESFHREELLARLGWCALLLLPLVYWWVAQMRYRGSKRPGP